MILALFVLLGVELWLIMQGPAWCILAPLFVAIALELGGYREAANRVALATLFFWLIFPCVLAIINPLG
jgi:hypothetical protein